MGAMRRSGVSSNPQSVGIMKIALKNLHVQPRDPLARVSMKCFAVDFFLFFLGALAKL